jgi:Zn-dependent protease
VVTSPSRPDPPPGEGADLARVAAVQVQPSAWLGVGVVAVALTVRFAPAAEVRGWWLPPLLAVVCALGLAGGVWLHEVAHAVTARLLGLPVGGITLSHLGGATHLPVPPRTWQDEAAIAAAGPATSLLGGGVLLVVGRAAGPRSAFGAALVVIGLLHGGLGAVNLLPGHPLDGGALLRAVVWGLTGDRDRGAAIAARLGQAVGLSLVVGGSLGAVPVAPGAGLGWLVVAGVGGLVWHAACRELGRIRGHAALDGMAVADRARPASFVADSRRTTGPGWPAKVEGPAEHDQEPPG